MNIIYTHESIIMPSAVFIRVFCAPGLTMRDIWNLEIPPRATALQKFKTYLKSIRNEIKNNLNSILFLESSLCNYSLKT